MEKEERSRLEKQQAAQAAEQTLSRKDFCDWRACAQNLRYKTHRNRTFLLWEVVDGLPKLLESYRSIDVEASFKDGVRILFRAETSDVEFWVTHSPSRIPDSNIFSHIPFMPDVTFLDAPGKRQTLRIPVVFKMECDPQSLKEDTDYLTDVVTYLTLFPSENGRSF